MNDHASSDDGSRLDWAEGHLREHLGALRGFLWNGDYLALTAWRAGLRPDAEGIRIADIGAGAGHFGRNLLPFAGEGATLTGVEISPDLVAAANEDAARAGVDARFLVGDAAAVPLPDDSFDLVVCQTLLMHLPDPVPGVAEMVRICKPGGVVLAVEPDILVNVVTSWWQGGDAAYPDDEEVAMWGVMRDLVEHRRARGGGDFRVGRRLPALLHGAGLVDVSAYRNERDSVLVPPYTRDEQPEYLAYLRGNVGSYERMGSQIFDADAPHIPGGSEAFAAVTKRMTRQQQAQLDAADAGTLVMREAAGLHICLGRKP